MEQLTRQQQKDLKVLINFVRIYCLAHHGGQPESILHIPAEMEEGFRKPVALCLECELLVTYAVERRRKCPLDPKPSCKHCQIHCYSKDYRARIREIMGFSGRRMIMRGRLDYLRHYFF